MIIPHTILYKYQKPCYWYFTSLAGNQIKKKSAAKVTIAHIQEIFTRKVSQSGIVAYYIYKKSGLESKYEIDNLNNCNNIQFESESDSNFNGNFYSANEKNPNSKYVIEYFNKEKFSKFLNSKNTYPDGILQKFIDPKGDSNFTIRLFWSPKLCILEKKINTKKICDKRFNLYERAVTYDGEEFQTETEAIRGNNLPDRFEKIGHSIASHISNITLERIKIVRMILNFKIGKNDKFYLLWCSSLRIENYLDKKYLTTIKDTSNKNNKNNSYKNNKSKAFGKDHNNFEKNLFDAEIPYVKNCENDKISVTYPPSVNLFQYSNQGRPIKVDKNILCKNCDLKIEQHKMCDITFRTLVEAHDSRKRDKNYNKLFENINMTSSGIELLPYIPNKGEEEKKLLILKNYKNLLIPKVIYALYPKLSYEDYKVLKKDTVFLSKNTQVCEKCFLDLTKYCNFAGTNTKNVLRVLKSSMPEDMYIKREVNNNNSNYNTTLNNFNNKINKNFISKLNMLNTYFNKNTTELRSKTPMQMLSNSNYNYNCIFDKNGKRIKIPSNINTQTMGSLNNKTNANNINNSSKLLNDKKNFRQDLSNKVKFVIEPDRSLNVDINNKMAKTQKDTESKTFVINKPNIAGYYLTSKENTRNENKMNNDLQHLISISDRKNIEENTMLNKISNKPCNLNQPNQPKDENIQINSLGKANNDSAIKTEFLQEENLTENKQFDNKVSFENKKNVNYNTNTKLGDNKLGFSDDYLLVKEEKRQESSSDNDDAYDNQSNEGEIEMEIQEMI